VCTVLWSLPRERVKSTLRLEKLFLVGVRRSPTWHQAGEQGTEVGEHEMTGEGALELSAVDVEDIAHGDNEALRLALDCSARDGIALGRGGT
jgi:hypothetical protein